VILQCIGRKGCWQAECKMCASPRGVDHDREDLRIQKRGQNSFHMVAAIYVQDPDGALWEESNTKSLPEPLPGIS